MHEVREYNLLISTETHRTCVSEHMRSHLNVQGRPHHLPILYQLRHNSPYLIHRYGKANAGGSACVGEDGAVDANHSACRIQQRAPTAVQLRLFQPLLQSNAG